LCEGGEGGGDLDYDYRVALVAGRGEDAEGGECPSNIEMSVQVLSFIVDIRLHKFEVVY
jgi:hypothetical protein